MPNERSAIAALVRLAAIPCALGAGATIFCYVATGGGIGLYFGGLAIAAILVPGLASQRFCRRDAFLAAASVIDGIGAVWLVSVFPSSVTLGQWLAAYVILAAVGMAMLGLTLLLRRVAGSTLAASLTTTLFIAWFAWPVWLTPFMSGRSGALVASWLAPAHPLLAMNRILIESGLWTQQPLMYRLTALGQDIPFSMPTSILACVFAHAIIALAAGLPAARSSGPAGLAPRRSAASPGA